MEEIIKVKSIVNYTIGTRLKDEVTKEVFEVLDTVRISVFDKVRYGLTLKLTKEVK